MFEIEVPRLIESQLIAGLQLTTTFISVWPSLAITCVHFDQAQMRVQVGTSVSRGQVQSQVQSRKLAFSTCDYLRLR